MYIYIYISIITALIVEFFPSVCNYCSHCRTIATGCKITDITLFELFEPAPHDFHLHNR